MNFHFHCETFYSNARTEWIIWLNYGKNDYILTTYGIEFVLNNIIKFVWFFLSFLCYRIKFGVELTSIACKCNFKYWNWRESKWIFGGDDKKRIFDGIFSFAILVLWSNRFEMIFCRHHWSTHNFPRIFQAFSVLIPRNWVSNLLSTTNDYWELFLYTDGKWFVIRRSTWPLYFNFSFVFLLFNRMPYVVQYAMCTTHIMTAKRPIEYNPVYYENT